MQRETTTATRVAENEHAFREANNRIEDAVDNIAPYAEIVPFICEGARRECTEIIPLARADYQGVRADARTFFVAPGHETTHVDGVEVAELLVKLEHFSLMQKLGKAGEVA